MLKSLFNQIRPKARFTRPSPQSPLCVIGDVHGCMAPLEAMLSTLPDDHDVILVGDYVDRGEHSAQVLRLLSARPDLTCLIGNHEDMMLRFLRDPERHGARWLRHGGLQTLASFGVGGVRAEMSGQALIDCRDDLLQEMGPDLLSWLEGLKTRVISGNVLVAHAGADPAASPEDQPDKALIWGHPAFKTVDRRDGVWVVHGHTIVASAHAQRGRIAVDTGAYATGQLSAVCLDGGEPKFLTTGG